jgi:hypothetical protein
MGVALRSLRCMFINAIPSGALQRQLLALLVSAALTACGGDVLVSPNAPPQPPTAPGQAPSAQNAAPIVSGTPVTSIAAGSSYSFVPTATDPDGGPLTFSISNRPSWATFSIVTGALTGTPPPGAAGSFANIVITASDGMANTALPAFSIVVQASSTGNGIAALSWMPPAENTDGSPLNDLAGHRIYHGTSANSLDQVLQLSNPAIRSHVFTGLPSGTHYFAMSAYTASGVEGERSAVASKTIP